jgi:ammonia channel protein AmtB
VAAWVGGLSTVFFFGLKKMDMFRVTDEDEEDGLDLTEHGGFAYNSRPSEVAQNMGNSRVSPA